MSGFARAGFAPAQLDVIQHAHALRLKKRDAWRTSSARWWLVAAAIAVAALPPGSARAQAGPALSLSEALQLATVQAPQLAAQRHAVEAADASIIPAGQLPDPKLALGIDNLPADGPDRFSVARDFMTMRRIGFMQDFPREEKLKLRGDKAKAEADRERATLAALSVDVKRDVSIAWLDTWFAQAQVRTLSDLIPETELLKEVAQAQLAGGKGAAADPIAARGAAVALQDRISEAQRNVRRAQAVLGRWLGAVDAVRPLDAAPDLTVLSHPPAKLLTGLEDHPELAAYAPMEAMARAEVGLAQAAKKPDWSLELSYALRGPAFSNMLSVAVRVDLPLWGEKRQDPLILASRKQLEKIQATREDAKRMHEAEIGGQLADWETAKERVARTETQLLPLARERTRATLAAYRGGRGDINAVLAARTNEIETRLALIQQQAELARAWANLNFLLDTEGRHTRETK